MLNYVYCYLIIIKCAPVYTCPVMYTSSCLCGHFLIQVILSIRLSTLLLHLYRFTYNRIDANCIHTAGLNMKGAAGPSGLNAHYWRRLCTFFHFVSRDLCHSLALLTELHLWITKAFQLFFPVNQ